MPAQLHKAVIAESGEVLADKIQVAEDFLSRSVGLLNRDRLEPGEGLLIKPCNSIHTFFMKFPIDVLFLDKTGHVIRIVESMPPWRLAACAPAGYMTLELYAGELKKHEVFIKSTIKLQK